MKKHLILVIAFLLFCSTAQATLIDNGDGTITQVRNDGSQLMWMQDANYAKTSGYDSDGHMNWVDANTWADNLIFAGRDDWRLPDVTPVNNINFVYGDSFDGSTDEGYGNTNVNSEMSYMFYAELGNLGYVDTLGNSPQSGWGLSNQDLFGNSIQYINQYYWSGVEDFGDDKPRAWRFIFNVGYQSATAQVGEGYAWAVRDIQPVPEPTTIALLGIGLAGLAGVGARRKWKKKAVDDKS